jgi:hypothetical protein
MPAALAFDYPTPAAIATFVLERLGYSAASGVQPDAPAATTAPARRLTDEEAEALLIQEWAAGSRVERVD